MRHKLRPVGPCTQLNCFYLKEFLLKLKSSSLTKRVKNNTLRSQRRQRLSWESVKSKKTSLWTPRTPRPISAPGWQKGWLQAASNLFHHFSVFLSILMSQRKTIIAFVIAICVFFSGIFSACVLPHSSEQPLKKHIIFPWENAWHIRKINSLIVR